MNIENWIMTFSIQIDVHSIKQFLLTDARKVCPHHNRFATLLCRNGRKLNLKKIFSFHNFNRLRLLSTAARTWSKKCQHLFHRSSMAIWHDSKFLIQIIIKLTFPNAFSFYWLYIVSYLDECWSIGLVILSQSP